MKKKLISLLQRKRHIVALSTILMTFIVMSCLFIDSVDITQMIDGKAAAALPLIRLGAAAFYLYHLRPDVFRRISSFILVISFWQSAFYFAG